MKKWIVLLLAVLLLTACGQEKEKPQEAVYLNITAEEAKEIMDSQEGYIILDVRTQEEYDQGNIPGAIVIPYEEIAERAAEVLPDRDRLILVYCRSGRRSKIAAETLVEWAIPTSGNSAAFWIGRMKRNESKGAKSPC